MELDNDISRKNGLNPDDVINSKKLFKNVFTVGTNTNGMINFWNADFFRLKNSGILMQISERQLFLEYEVIEGKGILPDYVVSGNLEETIGFITKDKKILKGKQ